jgi:hypothetical protein
LLAAVAVRMPARSLTATSTPVASRSQVAGRILAAASPLAATRSVRVASTLLGTAPLVATLAGTVTPGTGGTTPMTLTAVTTTATTMTLRVNKSLAARICAATAPAVPRMMLLGVGP